MAQRSFQIVCETDMDEVSTGLNKLRIHSFMARCMVAESEEKGFGALVNRVVRNARMAGWSSMGNRVFLALPMELVGVFRDGGGACGALGTCGAAASGGWAARPARDSAGPRGLRPASTRADPWSARPYMATYYKYTRQAMIRSRLDSRAV